MNKALVCAHCGFHKSHFVLTLDDVMCICQNFSAAHSGSGKTAHRELEMKDKNIHRTDKTGDFTVIDNRLIKDRRLSLGANW